MADADVDLRALVRAQEQLIDGLRKIVERLETRLAHLEASSRAATVEPAGRDSHDRSSTTDQTGDTVRDRRHLLSRAATAAAGAVLGGAALAVTETAPAAAAAGTFDGNPAVSADAVPGGGVGVRGSATSGIAVQGITTTGTGGYGYAQNGYGLVGQVGGGAAVRGVSSSGNALQGDIGTSGSHLVLTNLQTVAAPPGSALPRSTGAVVLDSTGDLWLCISGGTPGLWRRVSGTNTAGALTLLNAPVRVYDSRPGNPPIIGPKNPLANGATRTIDCTLNSSGVPVGATAVLANVTVVNTSANGFLVAYKQGVAVPAASTINWFQANTIAANTTVVACDAFVRIACYVPPTSSTDFFIDIIGYYR